jgi:hypothetical protein
MSSCVVAHSRLARGLEGILKGILKGIITILAFGAVVCSVEGAPSLPISGRSSLAMSKPVVATQPGSQTTTVADLVERLSRLRKPEREKTLAKLPPDTRQRIEKGLQQLDGMGPIEKQEALERFRAFTTLDSHGKEEIRAALASFKVLPDRRRQVLRSEMNLLHRMSKQQREQHMAADEFKSRFSVDERSILEKLTLVMRPY